MSATAGTKADQPTEPSAPSAGDSVKTDAPQSSDSQTGTAPTGTSASATSFQKAAEPPTAPATSAPATPPPAAPVAPPTSQAQPPAPPKDSGSKDDDMITRARQQERDKLYAEMETLKRKLAEAEAKAMTQPNNTSPDNSVDIGKIVQEAASKAAAEAAAKASEELNKLRSELQQERLAVVRQNVVARHNLGDFAEFVTGDTAEAIEASAKRLAEKRDAAVAATKPQSKLPEPIKVTVGGVEKDVVVPRRTSDLYNMTPDEFRAMQRRRLEEAEAKARTRK
jgi:hypothetical protein